MRADVESRKINKKMPNKSVTNIHFEIKKLS